MASSLRLKLNSIPEKFRRLIVCDKGFDLDVDICEKYGILPGKQAKKIKYLMAGLFFREIKINDLVVMLQKELAFPIEKAKSLALDIAGMRLLVVDDWLGGDIPAYIKSLGGRIEDYNKYVQDIKKSADEDDTYFKEQEKTTVEFDIKSLADLNLADNLKDSSEYKFDLKKEKEDSERIFGESLLELLDQENEDVAEDYNNVLLQILIESQLAAKNDLEKALYANQERLTSAPFSLAGKPSSATIANWLKDFLAVKGSGFFDNIAISDFLVKSPNALNLNDVEKARLRKFLVFYRNFKFFPESMPNATGDGWEIIPTQKTTEVQKEIKIVKEKELSESEKKVQQLRAVLAKYPEGSLPRRVVEEEMKKVKSNK